MQYLYHKDSGDSTLILDGNNHRYIFKVRRHKQGETIALRNLKNDEIFYYKIESLDKKEAHLLLERSEILKIESTRKLHIGWCLIDPKNIEKTLPSLNEMGVDSISFIYCSRSQKSFKLDFRRLEKILLNSSQQSGRSSMMRLRVMDSLEEFLAENGDASVLNFSESYLSSYHEISSIVIGCEGGFTPTEVALFAEDNILGLDTPLILRSESAVCAVASKLLF